MVTLRDLGGAGARAVTRYTGTLLTVFVVQSLVAIATMLACAVVLASVFAHLPIWDDAVDGDLVALVTCLRFARIHLAACAGIGFGALILWQLASWFLAGGVYGVLARRPEGRAETARTFGASGAATYLAYARLALCAVPGYLVVLFVFASCSAAVAGRIEHALTVGDLVTPVVVTLVPAGVVLHVLWTAIDYARVELTLRHDSHDPGALRAFLRALGFVIRRPLALVHASLGGLGFAAITIGYMYLAAGHPMYGVGGAVTLFVLRSGVSLARMALRFGVLAGQVALGGSRTPPARRVELKADAKPQ